MIPPGAVSCSLVSKSVIPATSSSFITTPTTKGTTRAGIDKLKWKVCNINELKNVLLTADCDCSSCLVSAQKPSTDLVYKRVNSGTGICLLVQSCNGLRTSARDLKMKIFNLYKMFIVHQRKEKDIFLQLGNQQYKQCLWRPGQLHQSLTPWKKD